MADPARRLRGRPEIYSGEAQPIVHDGVAYIVTGADDVFAISVETGDIQWIYEANLDQSIDVVCCGWTSRGVGLSEDKVFVGQLDAHMVALDRQTGEVVWDTQTEYWEDGYSLTSAPLYYDGLVNHRVRGRRARHPGRVKAYDADDGSLVWTFYTVPGPGEFGSETWPQPGDPYADVYLYGGGSVWQTPAVDPELGLVYFSTGNPGPDFAGSRARGQTTCSPRPCWRWMSTPANTAGTSSRCTTISWDYGRGQSGRAVRYRDRWRAPPGRRRSQQDRLGLPFSTA